MTQIDRNGLEVLDRAECIRLLRTVSLGRIGITAGATADDPPDQLQGRR